jgi:hypothetical protein
LRPLLSLRHDCPMNVIVSVDEASREETHRRLEELAAHQGNAVRPIYGQSMARPDLPEPIGSCTLVRIHGVALLLTAAHIVEHHKVTTLYVAGKTCLVGITATFHATAPINARGEDAYDFAACRLTASQLEALGDVSFIEEHEVAKGSQFGRGAMFGCLGFPLSKNKRVNATDHSVRTTLWKYASYEKASGDSATRPDAVANCHLFVQFDQKKGKDRAGATVNAIKPTGASGGPVFYLGNLGAGSTYSPNSPMRPMLAGILTKNPMNGDALRVTRIDVVLGVLERSSLFDGGISPISVLD